MVGIDPHLTSNAGLFRAAIAVQRGRDARSVGMSTGPAVIALLGLTVARRLARIMTRLQRKSSRFR